MSGVEKNLNRAELNAYKHYDADAQFALVPGIAHKKSGIASPVKAPVDPTKRGG